MDGPADVSSHQLLLLLVLLVVVVVWWWCRREISEPATDPLTYCPGLGRLVGRHHNAPRDAGRRSLRASIISRRAGPGLSRRATRIPIEL